MKESFPSGHWPKRREMTDESQWESIDVKSIMQNEWFPNLFSPLRVGPITLKNRIVNSAHQTGFAHQGNYTSQLRAYHRERARGGAAHGKANPRRGR